jgi:general secretion pathway protein G
MVNRRRKARDSRRGYTLTELLVVLVIISLLTAIVAPRLIGRIGKAKSTTARTQIENLISALDIYQLDMGEYPSTEQGLAALVTKPTESEQGYGLWAGPYLRRGKIPQDPWKKPFTYSLSPGGETIVITSLGKDAQIGGDGENRDISSND